MRCLIGRPPHTPANCWTRSTVVERLRRRSRGVNAFLSLSSILLVTLGSYLTIGTLHHLGDWSQRRKVQCFVLAAPLVSLGIGVSGLCLRGIAPWDSLLGVALPLTMLAVALGAIGLGLVRLGLMAHVIARSRGIADPELQALTDGLAQRFGLGSTRPRVLLRIYHRPLACTCGLWQPRILLSNWIIEHLDHRELEAVLAHELEHLARHDYFVTWLATVLRDAFFYIPTSWIAYRLLQQEKELACDDLVVDTTHRPLALASALTKVWLHTMNEPGVAQCSAAQSLVGAGETIKCRIERLLTAPEPPQNTHRSHAVILRMSISALVMLLLPGVANVTLMLVLMGCGPGLLLGKLF